LIVPPGRDTLQLNELKGFEMKVTIDLYVPEWAKWIAQDMNGRWYFYESEPFLAARSWSGWLVSCGRACYSYQSNAPKDFKKELYELY